MKCTGFRPGSESLGCLWVLGSFDLPAVFPSKDVPLIFFFLFFLLSFLTGRTISTHNLFLLIVLLVAKKHTKNVIHLCIEITNGIAPPVIFYQNEI